MLSVSVAHLGHVGVVSAFQLLNCYDIVEACFIHDVALCHNMTLSVILIPVFAHLRQECVIL